MDAAIRSLLRPDWDELEPYHPVKPLDVLAAEIGVAVQDLVKLDANENLYGPHPAVLAAIHGADLHIYPDPGQSALRTAIAAYVERDPGEIVAGQGADDLLDLILRAVQPSAIVDCPPTFGMYRFLAKVNHAAVVEVMRDGDFNVDVAGIGRAVRAGAGVIFLTSPNNPTGNPLAPGELAAILELGAITVLDEAYVEFGGTSSVALLDRHPNLVILRTFSKWAALAGLRVGYAVCHPDFATALMAIKQPYNVNVAADVAARAALEHRAEIFEQVRCIVAERNRMAGLASKLGWLEPLPSQANFVLFRVSGRDAGEVAAALRQRGILVRYYDRPELRGYIRISAGRPEDTDRLIAALNDL